MILDDKQILELVERYKWKGILTRGSDSKLKDETITVGEKEIGYAVNNISGVESITTVFKIKYNGNKIHVIPDYPSKKGAKQKT